ncbi:unnamed protein product, partial [Rotaria socialis]
MEKSPTSQADKLLEKRVYTLNGEPR